jgi:acetoin utilization deacetylase AcuC-like enzyme
MGYCIFANIAVAIEWARANRGVQRIAVVDYDVHHGNGTQSIFEADPDVLTISLHQDRLFPPDAGMRHEQGIGEGFGSVINIPMPAGCGNGAYIDAIDRVVAPAVRAFAPELILVASGFDASAADPLGRMSVTAAGYRAIAERLVVLARDVCDGKLVVSHEGGYSAVYVPYCGLAVLEALSGVHTGVKDPFAEIWDSSPVHALTPWQDEAISASAKLAEALQLIVPAAATTRGAAPR